MNGQPTIFVVDDDSMVLDSTTVILRVSGFAAVGFASAEEFLKAYAPSRIGVLLLDIGLPGMNGLELAQKLYDDGSKIPVILISGHVDAHSAAQLCRDAYLKLLNKPLATEELLASLHAAVELLTKE